ncbi:YciI family protein [Kribbella sp. NPDC056861]|uniref:YciI family protein n=1 Tax=Kribbella sp. NPDC056861 TaxID=3154857 RepID=UPI003427A924
MKQYLLSIYQPDGPIPGPEVLGPIQENLAVWNDELRAAGAWVFSAGLHPPESATVLRRDGSELLMTDGPFTEGKEHLGGFTIVRAEDLDEALGWARKLADILAPLSIEVRPFAG